MRSIGGAFCQGRTRNEHAARLRETNNHRMVDRCSTNLGRYLVGDIQVGLVAAVKHFSEGFLDEIRNRVSIFDVVASTTPLPPRRGRTVKMCCPLPGHQENTPSFYLYEGNRFHCYGCGMRGDAFGYLQAKTGMAFPEAVKQLAAQAGLELPQISAPEAEADARRARMHDVLSRAAADWHAALRRPEGAAALAYLHGRGVTDETITAFGIGWVGRSAPIGAPDALIAAGLMKPAEGGRPSRATFFDRIMIPIHDRAGRVISFGGRALGDRTPKYINGPKTEIFDKGRVLFNLHRAESAARMGAKVSVVEGYLDVAQASQAGYPATVGTLGGTLTEGQLHALWRFCPSPALCFDGDQAGAAGALRAANTALPFLEPDRSISFAQMPSGMDPDMLIRQSGSSAYGEAINAAVPLHVALFGMLAQPGDNETPENKTAYLVRLEAAAARIANTDLAKEYRNALRSRFYDSRRRGGLTVVASAQAASTDPDDERSRMLLALVLRHPGMLDDVEEALSEADMPETWCPLRNAVLASDRAVLMADLGGAALGQDAARALSDSPMPLPACAGPGASQEEATAAFWAIYGLMCGPKLDAQIIAAGEDFHARPTRETHARYMALCAARALTRLGEEAAV